MGRHGLSGDLRVTGPVTTTRMQTPTTTTDEPQSQAAHATRTDIKARGLHGVRRSDTTVGGGERLHKLSTGAGVMGKIRRCTRFIALPMFAAALLAGCSSGTLSATSTSTSVPSSPSGSSQPQGSSDTSSPTSSSNTSTDGTGQTAGSNPNSPFCLALERSGKAEAQLGTAVSTAIQSGNVASAQQAVSALLASGQHLLGAMESTLGSAPAAVRAAAQSYFRTLSQAESKAEQSIANATSTSQIESILSSEPNQDNQLVDQYITSQCGSAVASGNS